MPPPINKNDLQRHWSAECREFLDYWEGLRSGGMVPTFRHFADQMSPRLTPNCYIIELDETNAVIRFQGTDLVRRWHLDRTGKNVYADLPDHVQKLAHAAVLKVATHPCGLIGRNTFRVPSGMTVSTDFIQLPLGVDPGCLLRVVHYSTEFENKDADKFTPKFFTTTQPQWLDIGFGIPPGPLNELHVQKPKNG